MKDYKKILEGVMNIINTTENSDIVFAKICTYIDENCPELKEEIEDERIRKVLIELVKCNEKSGYKLLNNVPTSSMVAWLEKQGAQPHYNIGDVICDKSCTTLNKEAQPNMEIVDIQNGMYICDKGSFPVSQQDEYVLVSKKIDSKLNDDSVSNELRAASFAHAEKEMKSQTFPDNLEFELIYTFEEGVKWDAAQKSVWSKDDEYRTEKLLGWLNTLINYIQGDTTISLDLYRERKRQVEQLKTWLKSLKALNTWKPSDKQMEAFEHFVKSIGERGYFSPYDDNTKLLYSLLEQLKKL